MKKELLLSGALALSMMAAPMTAFAADFDGNTTTTPIHLSVEATPIDVTVTDSITMSVAANSTEAQVSDFSVTNNSKVGVIDVSNVNVTAKEGWTKTSYTTDFAQLDMGAKQFGLAYSTPILVEDKNYVDLNNDYAIPLNLNPETTASLKLKGQTGPVKTAVDDEVVADLILTIAYK